MCSDHISSDERLGISSRYHSFLGASNWPQEADWQSWKEWFGHVLDLEEQYIKLSNTWNINWLSFASRFLWQVWLSNSILSSWEGSNHQWNDLEFDMHYKFCYLNGKCYFRLVCLDRVFSTNFRSKGHHIRMASMAAKTWRLCWQRVGVGDKVHSC